MNKLLLQQHIQNKLVSVQKHPDADLYIYNYTPTVQYERLWDEVTRQTRGLILDGDMNIVARPFGKFFNIEEHTPDEIPNLPFDIFDKMDGSLGILYWIKDKPFISTRGSFTSDQAKHATEILYKKYSHTFNKIDHKSTYLFEIIYPQNRIVIDYGEMDDLVLLTIIDNLLGEERIEEIGFSVVKKYDGINDITELKKLEQDNKEGFVVRFINGFRIKVKFAEYCRLHRIITQVSNVVIWEYLSEDRPFDELLDRVPDEFYQWVKDTKEQLIKEFNIIRDYCISESYKVKSADLNRKEIAEIVKKTKYPAIIFNMIDEKAYFKLIWKLVRPTYSRPFTKEI